MSPLPADFLRIVCISGCDMCFGLIRPRQWGFKIFHKQVLFYTHSDASPMDHSICIIQLSISALPDWKKSDGQNLTTDNERIATLFRKKGHTCATSVSLCGTQRIRNGWGWANLYCTSTRPRQRYTLSLKKASMRSSFRLKWLWCPTALSPLSVLSGQLGTHLIFSNCATMRFFNIIPILGLYKLIHNPHIDCWKLFPPLHLRNSRSFVMADTIAPLITWECLRHSLQEKCEAMKLILCKLSPSKMRPH